MTTFRAADTTGGMHRVDDHEGAGSRPVRIPDVDGVRRASRSYEAESPARGTGPRSSSGATEPPLARDAASAWERSHWPSLASDFWWLVHSEQTGSLQVDALVAGLGLAGALLCELAMARLVFVHQQRLRVTEAALRLLLPRPDDPYGGSGADRIERGARPPESAVAVLRAVVAEPHPLPVADWLAYLSRQAYPRAAEQMLTAGLVRAERIGRLSRRRVYLPADVNVSGWASARLRIQLERDGRFGLADCVLLGLCVAAGIHRRVFDGVHPDLVAALPGIRDGLPEPLPEILQRTEVAVAGAVLHRP